MVDILVLHQSMHGMPSSECATALRERLPAHHIVHAESPAHERELISEAAIVVGGAFRDELIERATSLRVFACYWAGVDHLDLDYLSEQGIVVTNAAGVHGPNIAEHVIGWFLLITRRLDEGIRRQERHEWRHFQAMGEFAGSRVAVVGMGAIGQAIIDRLDGFSVTTIGVRYSPEKGGKTDEVYGFADITEALSRADYVVIACPLTDETEGLIAREALQALSPDAVLVNVGRGPIVETDALVHALQFNQLHAAALDVTDPEPLPTDHPLWSLENCFITPHNAGHTPQYWDRVAGIVARNVEQIEETGEWDGLENQVNTLG